MLPPNGQRTSPPSSHACPSSPSRDSHSVRPGRCAHPEPEKDTLLRRHYYDYYCCCQTTCAHIRSLPSSSQTLTQHSLSRPHTPSQSVVFLCHHQQQQHFHSLIHAQPPTLPRHAPTFLFWPLASSIRATRSTLTLFLSNIAPCCPTPHSTPSGCLFAGYLQTPASVVFFRTFTTTNTHALRARDSSGLLPVCGKPTGNAEDWDIERRGLDLLI